MFNARRIFSRAGIFMSDACAITTRMRVTLHSSPTFAPAWDAVFLPWLRKAAAVAWQQPRPTLVLVPMRSDASMLKSKLLAAGEHALGIEFVTPARLRPTLAQMLRITLRAATRENLRLLLAVSAESFTSHRDDGIRAAARAAASSPDALLHAIDQANAGGWNFGEVGPASLRPIVAEFERQLDACGFAMMHDIDRELHRAARRATPGLANLFVGGFSAAHWPIWPLLVAATSLAENATVCLLEPRDEAADLDRAWIGTWEETFGASSPVEAESPAAARFADLLRVSESPGKVERARKTPAREVEFLVGQNTPEQARAIVAKTLQFLADPACERIGMLFPRAGSLAREVARLLAEMEIAHDDVIGQLKPPPFPEAGWNEWLALQESARLEPLIRFVRASGAPELFSRVEAEEIENALRRAFGEILIDDLRAIAAALLEFDKRDSAAAIARSLQRFPLLPERGSLADFVARTLEIFDALGWQLRAAELRRHAAEWSEKAAFAISRRAFLRWLADVFDNTQASRAAAGNHPYSRVHLLLYPQAETQPWTHLILAGLNEGAWPRTNDDDGYIGDEEVEALNRRWHALNTDATREGSQGEGHAIVRSGRTLCLGPMQKRAIVERQFLNSIESTSVAIAVTASLFEESQPSRPLNPSEFFTRLYLCARGRAVTHQTMVALRGETAEWLKNVALPQPTRAPSSTVEQTRIAFAARRARDLPFGEYEFALREPPLERPSLAATQWERALSQPAIVWMSHFLGVGARDDGLEDPWSTARGKWAHRWLAAASGAPGTNRLVPRPTGSEILDRVTASAQAFRGNVARFLALAGHDALPDWWLSAWRETSQIVTRLARRVADVQHLSQLATEWKIEAFDIAIADGKSLRLRGRIDLLLGAEKLSERGVPEEAWIVDYKTGARGSLAPKGKDPATRAQKLATDLAKGKGLQLALYALALRELGATNLAINILTPDLKLDAPQLTLADIESQTSLWLALERMQSTGIFGMRGPLRDEFSFIDAYPLATLAIDPAILEEKWRLTHPMLTDSDEEDAA